MTSLEVRDKLVDALVLDLIGPIHDPTRQMKGSTRVRWYLTGFLVPRARPSMDLPKERRTTRTTSSARMTTRLMSLRPTPCRSTIPTRPPWW